MDTGETVAAKQVSLKGVPKSELASIEVRRTRDSSPQASAPALTRVSVCQVEINLLQKLIHPNIVKYIATFRTDDNLYIILECVVLALRWA